MYTPFLSYRGPSRTMKGGFSSGSVRRFLSGRPVPRRGCVLEPRCGGRGEQKVVEEKRSRETTWTNISTGLKCEKKDLDWCVKRSTTHNLE